MIDIRVDTEGVKVYDGEEMIEEINGEDMILSDFSIGNIGKALALYTALCNVDDDKVIVKFM